MPKKPKLHGEPIITTNPHISNGAPIVKNTRITAEQLFKMYKQGMKPEAIDAFFEMNPGCAQAAIDYHKRD